MKEELTEIITNIFKSFEEENMIKYSNILKSLDIPDHIDIKDPDTFNLFLKNNLDNILEVIVKTTVSEDDKIVFLYTHYDFLEAHFLTIIKKYDDLGCSSDKSSYLLKSLLNYFLTGKEIVHDYEGQYSYHLPKNCFQSHEKIVTFFEAIYRLYYGNNDLFFKYVGIENESCNQS